MRTARRRPCGCRPAARPRPRGPQSRPARPADGRSGSPIRLVPCRSPSSAAPPGSLRRRAPSTPRPSPDAPVGPSRPRPRGTFDKTRPIWSDFLMRRNVLIALIVLGVGLILAPVAFQMFSRAPKGAQMLDEFKPFMTERRLGRFESYMPEIDAAVRGTDTKLQPYLAEHAGIDRGQFDTRFATFTTFTRQWPAIDKDMSDLLRRVHGNLDNYDAVAALPSFTLFPWFFVLPGVLIAGLAALALVRPRPARVALPLLAVLGVGLVAAPLVFQMFQRAPKGGEMMDEFRSIMKRHRVQTIQGYFATMAVGQGAIRIDLIPAAKQAGGQGGAALTDEEFARQFPAVAKLNRDWIGIINDMTP